MRAYLKKVPLYLYDISREMEFNNNCCVAQKLVAVVRLSVARFILKHTSTERKVLSSMQAKYRKLLLLPFPSV